MTVAPRTIFAIVGIAATLLGYPIAAFSIHGLNISVWPEVVLRPDAWFVALAHSYGLANIEAYVDMAYGICPAFPAGGRWCALVIFLAPIAAAALLVPTKAPSKRDPRGTFGNARWATAEEKSRMREGVELGIDPDTARPIRFMFEGNFLTIAPPRTGKTSGLAIPNMWVPAAEAWPGPAVVIDPKAQVFNAVGERRRSFGRRVICIDPMNLAGGIDGWCPMQNSDPSDVLYMQRIARALLPAAASAESAYFQSRATDVIATAMRAAIMAKDPTPLRVSKLLSDPEVLAKHLDSVGGDVMTDRVRTLLAMEPRTRDPIVSTAMQAFQWNDDARMQRLTNKSTFQFEELCRDNIDLFLALPTESLEVLAPFVKWFLIDLFTAIRRNPPIERALIFVDEARALGRFSELVVASGELPGYRASLWTFWQDRSQISAIYGEHDAATLLRTAEFLTISDPASVDPDECNFWSKALADFTLLQETRTSDTSGNQKRTSTTTAPTAARLMTAEELARLPAEELIVFPKSPRYAKRPLRLLKTRHDDARFANPAQPQQ